MLASGGEIRYDKLVLSPGIEMMWTEITNLRETSSVTSQTAKRHLDSLKDELATTRRQANSMATQAKTEALKHAEQLAAQIEAEQKKQQEQVASQLSQVKQSADTQIAAVNTDVSGVKSQLGTTQAELQKTVADLKRVTGDLGVQSGYVATNGKEIAALKRLGERNIVEFNLAKSKAPQRVGDISLTLKKSDAKHNRYTIEVLADDNPDPLPALSKFATLEATVTLYNPTDALPA